jgi:hypothetical protein
MGASGCQGVGRLLSIAPAPRTTSVWGAGAILIDKTQKALLTLAGAAPH